MKRMRITAIILAMTLATTAFTGCNTKLRDKDKDKERVTVESTETTKEIESTENKGSPKIYIGGSLNTPIETNNSNINEIYINKKPHIINIHEEALVFDIINIAKKATIPPSNIFIIIKIIYRYYWRTFSYSISFKYSKP